MFYHISQCICFVSTFIRIYYTSDWSSFFWIVFVVYPIPRWYSHRPVDANREIYQHPCCTITTSARIDAHVGLLSCKLKYLVVDTLASRYVWGYPLIVVMCEAFQMLFRKKFLPYLCLSINIPGCPTGNAHPVRPKYLNTASPHEGIERIPVYSSNDEQRFRMPQQQTKLPTDREIKRLLEPMTDQEVHRLIDEFYSTPSHTMTAERTKTKKSKGSSKNSNSTKGTTAR